MKKELYVILLILSTLTMVPMVHATTITGIGTPPESLGIVPIGSTKTLSFSVTFTESTQTAAIIVIDYDTNGFSYQGYAASLNGSDISGQFESSDVSGQVTLNNDNMAAPNGDLVVEVYFQTGMTEGNYTFDWREIYMAFPEPPDPPVTSDISGSISAEVLCGMVVNFYAGWNLFGVPSNMRYSEIEEVFNVNISYVDAVYGFDNRDKAWTYWINGLPPEAQSLHSLEPGKGYWVNAYGDFNQTLLFDCMGTGGAPLDGFTVQIGVISPTTVGLDTLVPFFEDIIAPDINAYSDLMGYDVNFEFVIMDAEGQAAIHLEKMQELHSMNISLVIGGGWSSQAQASLGYANDNDMLIFSYSSTSPLLSIADDNLYRLSPTDTKQTPAISEMLLSQGKDVVIVMQRGDSWADGIYNYLIPDYMGNGGVIYDRIRYTAETTDFTSYLNTVENSAALAVSAYGWARVAFELISFDEAVTILQQAASYPILYNLTWFGSDGTARSSAITDNAGSEADHVRLFSTIASPQYSAKWEDLADRYVTLTGQPLGFYTANNYDISWILAKAVLEAQSSQAVDVIPLLDQTCYDMFGATGWCRLDDAGDRYGTDYDIWGYEILDTYCENVLYGYYNSIDGQVYWDTDALGYTP